jgi:hypothetical protein
MRSKAQANESLSLLFLQVRVPDTLVVNGAQEQVKVQEKGQGG